jgi:hypothetical protein
LVVDVAVAVAVAVAVNDNVDDNVDVNVDAVLASCGNERPQPVFAQVEPFPDQRPHMGREQHVAEQSYRRGWLKLKGLPESSRMIVSMP